MNTSPRAIIVLLVVLASATIVPAATYTVTNAADVNYGGTLRWALNSVGGLAVDTIAFNLPAPYRISPTGGLPTVNSWPGTIIDGTTQPGYSGTPLVHICGTGAPVWASGIYLNSDSNTVKGLIISGFGDSGIFIDQGDSNVVEGCYVMSNRNYGVYVYNAGYNRIGGTNAAVRNVITRNPEGITLEGAFRTLIQGNYIGLDAAGAPSSNSSYGIHLNFAPSNTIGGAVPGAGNVIGCSMTAIYLQDTNTCGTIIQGNRIGTDPSGSARRENDEYGIQLADSRNTQIGGTNANARNVISGSGRNGIMSEAGAGGGHVIEGNYIGTDASGTFVISNAWSGMALSVPYCRVGGTNAASRNVVSGNGSDGIGLGGTNVRFARVFGNYVGTDVSGTVALGNGNRGINGSGIRDSEIGKGVAGCGNVVCGNASYGIGLNNGARDNLIAGNRIGVDASGTVALPNNYGVYISNAGPTNKVGGSSSERNIIAGNLGHGVMVAYSTGTVIRSNYIGLNTGLFPLGNGENGVYLQWSWDFDVGGSVGAQGNIIGDNRGGGIVVMLSSNGYVRNNFVGLTGVAAASNAQHGVDILNSSKLEVRQNTIAANGGHGVRLMSGSSGITLANNFIGTDSSGFSAMGNMGWGVNVESPAVSNVIGGTDGASGNTISGNGTGGVFLNGSDVRYTTIAGNQVGTDSLGRYAVPNGGQGVSVYGPVFTTIGGTNAGARNVISGNADRGVAIGGDNCYSNLVQGNIVGMDGTGTSPIPNARDGVYIGTGSSNNLVGGLDAAAKNLIAFNRGIGILVYDSGAGTARGNLFLGNSIKRNEGMGIDLSWDGVTANDPGDPDVGPNRRQNYPVLLGATNDGVNVTVRGYLDSLSSTPFSIEIFGNRDPDLTGYGEGEYLMGRVAVVTPVGGVIGFTGVVSTAAGTPNFITATATAIGNNDTSEFSQRLLLDSDGDGMGDGYELEYFAHHTAGDPAGDDDFDTVNNLGEFLAETNPHDAGSHLRVTQMWREFGNTYYTLASSDCRNYSLQFSWNLVQTPEPSWWDQFSFVTRTNGFVTLYSSTGSDPLRIYRFQANMP